MNRQAAMLIALSAIAATPAWAAGDTAHAHPQYGKVQFPTSCNPTVQEQFETGVAQLHSFFYPEDVKTFQAVIAADPQCAMGYWGLAASQRPNPLVPPWPDANLKRGLEAIEKGKVLAATERERDWLEALELAFRD